MISLRSRVVRTLLAASTLHLMLAVPARACPTEMMAATATQAAATSHADHAMAGMTMPDGSDTPAPSTPGTQHKPCCPAPASGCQSSNCLSSTVAALSVVSTPAPTAPLFAPCHVDASRLVSFAHAPEPPPPRA